MGSNIQILDGKVEQISIDMDNMNSISDKFKGNDIAFCCLGTTRADAGSPEAFMKVDYDYVVNFATLSKDAGIEDFHVVSSTMTSPNSWFLYPRTKGLMEKKCQEIGFKNLVIYKPGLLKRDNPRFVEKCMTYIAPSLPVSTLGAVMGKLASRKFWETKKDPSKSGFETVSSSQTFNYFKQFFE